MIWVWVFLAIALAGLITAVAYAVWLWHKAADLFSEVAELGKRTEELLALLGQIDFDRLTPASQPDKTN